MTAIFGPRTEFCCQIWSHSATFGPTAWDKIWQQNLVLGPNMVATFYLGHHLTAMHTLGVMQYF